MRLTTMNSFHRDVLTVVLQSLMYVSFRKLYSLSKTLSFKNSTFCEKLHFLSKAPLPRIFTPFSPQKCVSALDKTWHPEHFFCCQCGKQFGEEGYHEMDGKAYCRDCYFDSFAPKCAGCNQAITDNFISALNSQWHPDCFVCWVNVLVFFLFWFFFCFGFFSVSVFFCFGFVSIFFGFCFVSNLFSPFTSFVGLQVSIRRRQFL